LILTQNSIFTEYIQNRTCFEYSVFTEYSEYTVFNPKTGVSNIPYFLVKFQIFYCDAIFGTKGIYTEQNVFRILWKNKFGKIPSFAGPWSQSSIKRKKIYFKIFKIATNLRLTSNYRIGLNGLIKKLSTFSENIL